MAPNTATAPKKKAVKKTAKTAVVKKTAKKTLKKSTTKATQKKTPLKTTTKKVATQSTSNKTSSTPIRSSLLTAKSIAALTKRQPLGHLLLEQKLHEAGFHGDIESSLDVLARYSTDESIFAITPQLVISPRRVQDVAVAVRVVAKTAQQFPALSLTPRSAGTGLSGGSLTDSVVIDVARHLSGIQSVEATKNGVSISVLPGTMWPEVEKKLARYKVYIPSLPASKDICSVGGSVANNAAGANSLRYGHTASWIESLDVVLRDGETYHVRPISYTEYRKLIKKDNAYATILREVLDLLATNARTISANKPHTKKNSAGYALWDTIDGTVTDFKKGNAKLDLTQLIAGSQGTLGIVTGITLKTTPLEKKQSLICVPVFNLAEASQVITEALRYNPINIEVFDALSFDLALANPSFFRDRLSTLDYYRVMFSLYTTYHVRYKRTIPAFTFLITLDESSSANTATALTNIRNAGGRHARAVINHFEAEMLWQVRRGSYSLSKFQDQDKRPAAFLEDMTVPPAQLSSFLTGVQKLLRKYNITAAIHGHGGNGHFHFYPLFDFTKKGVPDLIERMSEEFFSLAISLGGNICGEHNDGIVRTPHLNKMFSKKMLDTFVELEHIFDPDDIFNPGKKVNPRFDIKENIRRTN